MEDDPDDETLLMHMLQKASLDNHVEVIRDGERAFSYLDNEESEAEELIAVFLDLNLPSVHGLDLLRKIRGCERIRHLPVVVMTASLLPKDMDESRRLGVSAYLKKPISLAAFTKAIADTFHTPSTKIQPSSLK